jgi:hypothetical protein
MALGIWLIHNYCPHLYIMPNWIGILNMWDKNSILNLITQLSCTLDATIVLEYTSSRRALLFVVSKQNLKPFS